MFNIIKYIPLMFIISCNIYTFDYYTKHKINVKIGIINNPTKEIIEKWTDDLIKFWRMDCVENSISNTDIIFTDKETIIIMERKVKGYSCPWSKYIEIGVVSSPIDFNIIKSLFFHELSHIILYGCMGIENEEEGHIIFKKNNATF